MTGRDEDSLARKCLEAGAPIVDDELIFLKALRRILETGPEFYRRFASFAPGEESKVVFLTGGATSPENREFLAHCGAPCLEKPIDVPQLTALIQTKVR